MNIEKLNVNIKSKVKLYTSPLRKTQDIAKMTYVSSIPSLHKQEIPEKDDEFSFAFKDPSLAPNKTIIKHISQKADPNSLYQPPSTTLIGPSDSKKQLIPSDKPITKCKESISRLLSIQLTNISIDDPSATPSLLRIKSYENSTKDNIVIKGSSKPEILLSPPIIESINTDEWDIATQKFNQENKKDTIANEFGGITSSKALALLNEGLIFKVKPHPREIKIKRRNCFLNCTYKKALPLSLEQEVNMLLSYQYIEFDTKNETHHRMLYSLYYLLTNKRDCMWQKIGFKHNNPNIELSKNGVLAILGLLNFTEKNCAKAVDFMNTPKELTFVYVGMECTAAVMNAIKIGALNSTCIRLKSVYDSFYEYFSKCIFLFYSRNWANSSKFIKFSLERILKGLL